MAELSQNQVQAIAMAVSEIQSDWSYLFWSLIVWLLIVAILYPLIAWFVEKRYFNDHSNLRALNLPRGSVRGILALVIVGSFILMLVFGGNVFGEKFETVVAALGSLSAAVIGFYFGARVASPPPNGHEKPTEATDTPTDERTQNSEAVEDLNSPKAEEETH